MGNEKSDWEAPIEGLCVSCIEGYHECAQDEIGYACECSDCTVARLTVASEVHEFFNGLEDFFKSIDPDRIGWDTIEAEALADAGDLVL